MQVVNKKMCVIVILMLVIIESCTLFLMYKSYGNKNTNLDEVNLNINNSNMFAIMLEQDDGTYKEDTSNTWPTSGYTYNESMSGCIDINGNKIDGVLTYDSTNKIATVDTGNTSYCYLYFSLPPYASQKNEMWDSPLEGDGYRYVGPNPNNYICFGTTDKTTCTSNTDLYMYRIIGIFKDEYGNEHLKLIKKEDLNEVYAWHSSNSDVNWDESDLYKGINGDYFLSNTTYSYMQDNIWTSRISDWNYISANTLSDENYNLTGTTHGINYNYNIAKTIYLHELNRNGKVNQVCNYYIDYVYDEDNDETIEIPTIADCSVGKWTDVTAKIGLMYVSDYMLSLGENYINSLVTENYITFATGWIHLNQNDASPATPGEWTMTRYGYNGYFYDAWRIYTDGGINNYLLAYAHSVRPVFYLISDVEIIGGTGMIDNPFIIN